MSDDPKGNARVRFARHLRRIREDREVSVAQVQRDTQISRAQIESFESGRLFDQESMNEVYLRAFVRAYAETLEIAPTVVLDHLNHALEGRYEDGLLVEFLGVPPSLAEEEGTSQEEENEDSSADSDNKRDSESESPPTEETLDEGAEHRESSETVQDVPDGGDQEKERVAGDLDESIESTPSWFNEEGDVSEETSESDTVPIDKGDQPSPTSWKSSPSPLAERLLSLAGMWRRRRREIVVVGIAIILLLLVVGGLVFFSDGGSGESADVQSSPTAGLDESKVAGGAVPDTTDSQAGGRPPAEVTLGDTMYVTVFADGVVRRMQARQDDDLRRPYWIEAGEALVFPFTERLILENRLDSSRVFLEQYPFPRARLDDRGRLVIDRQAAQSFVDSLRGDPVSLSVQPDTVEIRAAPSERDSV